MEEILHHLTCMKPCKHWDIYHINWLAVFLPSTVSTTIQRLFLGSTPQFQWQMKEATLSSRWSCWKKPTPNKDLPPPKKTHPIPNPERKPFQQKTIPNPERKLFQPKTCPKPTKKDNIPNPPKQRSQDLLETTAGDASPSLNGTTAILPVKASGTSALAEQLRVAKGLGARKRPGGEGAVFFQFFFLRGEYMYVQ